MDASLKKLKRKMELTPKFIVNQLQLFKNEVFIFDLNDEVDSNQVAEICHFYKTEEFKEKENKTALTSWRSDNYPVANNRMPKFQFLIDLVSQKLKPIWKHPYTFVVDHYWFAIYNNGDYAVEHDHGQADLSCVYYVSVPENSAPLILPSKDGDVLINPKTGMLVVFPGKCSHKVPKSEHQGERIIISMNIFKDKFLGFIK